MSNLLALSLRCFWFQFLNLSQIFDVINKKIDYDEETRMKDRREKARENSTRGQGDYVPYNVIKNQIWYLKCLKNSS